MSEEPTTNSPVAPAPAPVPLAPPVTAPHSPAAPMATQGPITALSLAQQVHNKSITITQAGALAKAGGIDAMDIAKSFSILNEPGESKAPETQSPEVTLLDEDGFVPAKGSDYMIRYAEAGDGPLSEALKQFDGNVREWMSSAGLHRALGNSFVTYAEQAAQQTAGMNEDQLDRYGRAEYAKLEHVYGAQLEEKLQRASQMIAELDAKRPGLKQLLQSGAVFDNAVLVNLILQAAPRYFARRKGTR